MVGSLFALCYEQAMNFENTTLGDVPPIVAGGRRVKCSPSYVPVARAELRDSRHETSWKDSTHASAQHLRHILR
jgi:hypothetical protein